MEPADVIAVTETVPGEPQAVSACAFGKLKAHFGSISRGEGFDILYSPGGRRFWTARFAVGGPGRTKIQVFARPSEGGGEWNSRELTDILVSCGS